ncbi:MAG: Holliday junction branch migration protein RuvA [Clostridia bacterium]|nr:Holliday junction branch migration protein RuvA [Clostridia bacterium]
MYYYIKGELVLKQDNFAVLDNGGVGYKIYTSQLSAESVSIGSRVTFYTYVYVREDILDIYGFVSQDELSMFLQLLSVSGVGPKAALAILSVVTPPQLALAVMTNDAKTLTKASGVGAKMAQRVILELKDKLKNADIVTEGVTDVQISADDSTMEAVTALTVLGYSQQEAKNAVAKIDPALGVEEIIKQALKSMAG